MDAILDRLQRAAAVAQLAGEPLQDAARLAQFRQGPVEGRDGRLEAVAGPFALALDQAGGGRDPGLGAAIARDLGQRALDGLQQAGALAHQRPLLGQLGLLLGCRLQVALGDAVTQVFLVGAGLGYGLARLGQPLARPDAGGVGGGDRGQQVAMPGEGVEQAAVGAGVEQALLVELAVDLDQRIRQPAQAGNPRSARR